MAMTSPPKETKPAGGALVQPGSSKDEFALIEDFFAPLARGNPFAFGLLDDAAVIRPRAGRDIVVTKDAMVSGVHFLASDPADLVARKLLRVNLSDLAAKGAQPSGYLLACAWPGDLDVGWIAQFTEGLAQDQALYGVTLLGGDTVRTPGPLTLSLTAFGDVDEGRMIGRAGARAGDLVFVSGTIGDAGLGLKALQGEIEMPNKKARDFVIGRYRLPEPRVSLGAGLVGVAHACIDVSDGLVADAGHIAQVSQVTLRLWIDRAPLSQAALMSGEPRERLITWGDDYELLFTAAAQDKDAIEALGQACGVSIAVIGEVDEGTGVRVLDRDGKAIAMNEVGYKHF